MKIWFWRRRGEARLPVAARSVPDAQKLLFGDAPPAPDAAPPPPAPEEAAPAGVSSGFGLEEAEALVGAGQVDKGLAAYERIAAREPGFAEAWFRIGTLRQELGDVPGALLAWESAVSCDATHWLASMRLATALAGLNRRMLALDHLIRARTHAPHLGELSIHLSNIYARIGWLDKANEALAHLERPLPGWWEQAARNVEKITANLASRLEGLERQLGEGKHPAFSDRLATASALLAMGRIAESEAILHTLVAQRPDQWPAHGELAGLLARTQGIAEALDYLRGLTGAASTGADYVTALAQMLHESADGDAAGSIAALRLLLNLRASRPQDPAICRDCATIALAIGDDATFELVVRAWLAIGEPDSLTSRFAIASARRQGAVARFGAPNAAPGGAATSAAPGGAWAEPASPMPIVQFWGQLPPPEDVAETMRSWHAFNPTLPHITFDSAGARAFVADQAGQAGQAGQSAVEHFDAARHPAMQADIFRLVFLAKHGGIYVDADEICRRPIDDLVRRMLRVKLAAWLSSEIVPYVNNAFLAANPGCPIIATALQESLRLLDRHRTEGNRADIWQVTGPGLITRAIGRHLLQPGTAGEVMLLTELEYRSFAHTVDLAYKKTDAGNWRLH